MTQVVVAVEREGTVRSLIDVSHRPTGAASQVKAQGQCALGLIRQVDRITEGVSGSLLKEEK